MSNQLPVMKVFFISFGCALLFSLGVGGQTLKITSPADKYKAFPGQQITVDVSVSGDSSLLRTMGIIGELPIGASQLRYSSPYRFEVEVPGDIKPGLYSLVAVASRHVGREIYSDPIYLDVQTAEEPVSYAVIPPKVWMSEGDFVALRVVAKLPNGSNVVVTNAAATTIESRNPAIATVYKGGMVKAMSAGTTAVVVNGNIEVPIVVRATKVN
jgi:hypothetical protein